MNTQPISLITGATGLAGRALSKKLLAQGHKLKILVLKGDRLLTEYFALFKDTPEYANKIEVCEGDITNYETIAQYFVGVFTVYHVAALVSGDHSRAMYQKVNVQGTQNVLDACLNAKVNRVITVATADVYGLPNGNEITDTSAYSYWGEPYADSKIDAAKLVKRYVKEKGLKATLIHPGWVYGPGDQNLIPAIVEMVQSGTVVTWGAMKTSVLDMIHVLANGMLIASQSDETIGIDIIVSDNSEGITFPDLVTIVGEQLHCKYKSTHLPYWLMMTIAKMSAVMKKLGLIKCTFLSTTDVRSFGLVFPFQSKAAKAMGWQRQVDTKKAFADCVKLADIS